MKLIAVAAGALMIAAASAGGQGDPTRGEVAFQKCYACHSVEQGAAALDGPSLRGVVGRRVADEAGFDYSPALRALAKRESAWSEALLDRYIADPEAVAPGTTMGFFGMRDARERADVIAYLRASASGPAPSSGAAASAARSRSDRR